MPIALERIKMTDNHNSLSVLNITLDFGNEPVPVGRLATKDRCIYFEYDAAFLKQNLNISPFNLPLKTGVQSFEPHLFEGLPGVFNDSLSDGWGRLLLDRMLRSKGFLPGSFSPLDRLAHVGCNGMGALVYEPDCSEVSANKALNLDALADQSRQVLEGDAKIVLEELLALNGSSAGARPKAMIGVSVDKTQIIEGRDNPGEGYESWLVKFPNISDGQDAGAVEFVYAQMVKLAGITMTESHLFPSAKGAGYFATKRFDRLSGGGRVHVHTACGLLHSDFRVPSLDYQDLIKATMVLTRDIREAQDMYRLAVFNVLSHNRDDHAKNFSFLMDRRGKWRMAPAYDLTFSSGPSGEQSTMVMGEGKNPGVQHLIKLAQTADLSKIEAQKIIDQTCTALSQWKTLASHAGVSKDTIERVDGKI
ncbi:Toxin HigB / Protein kinase domain of HipA [hydrothermal vent metagenome]|uniref:Toxin HigB / Protein kinase domain of HipA n=1 Tax=hydrothermal vent metagenome TaxID=652676 RepID=A0A3B1D5I3_9ZZZZ